MLRHLYRCAVFLHPAAFRRRFGDEMLSIFDQAPTHLARLCFLGDGIVSCLRQWALRPEILAAESHPALSDGLPSFSTLDAFRPRTSAVIDGIILSAALFAVTCFAIRYSWIRVLHVQIPGYQAESYFGVHPTASPTEFLGKHPSSDLQSPAELDNSSLISEHLQVDVLPVEEAPATAPSLTGEQSNQIISAPPRPTGTLVRMDLHLDLYAGTYECRSPRISIRIAVDGDHLSMRIDDEPKRALSPLSPSEFTIAGEEDSAVEFLADKNGKIDRLRLSRDGQQVIAERQ